MSHDDDIPPEEKEKWSLDRERDADALTDYMKVERVIGTREGDDGDTEYYVKCTVLSLIRMVTTTDGHQGRVFITTPARGRAQL